MSKKATTTEHTTDDPDEAPAEPIGSHMLEVVRTYESTGRLLGSLAATATEHAHRHPGDESAAHFAKIVKTIEIAHEAGDPLKIQHRAGHVDFDTTQRYIREADALREGFGAPFPELPKALFQSHAEPESHTPIARAVVSARKDRDDSACNREPNPPVRGRQCLTPAVPTVSSKPCSPIPPRH